MIEIRHTDKPRPIYDQIYTTEKIHQMDSFFIWINVILEIKQHMKVLDIATGRGQMVQFTRQRGATAIGTDFSSNACRLAFDRNPDQIVCSDGEALPFPSNYFDRATNLGSLEHFNEIGLGIQEMARVLKPDGLACLAVPNTFGLRWNVQHAWRTGDVDDDGQPIQRYGTRNQWVKLLTENGLAVVKILGYEHDRAFPRTFPDLLGYLKHPRRMISMLIVARIMPVSMAGQFIFICKPT